MKSIIKIAAFLIGFSFLFFSEGSTQYASSEISKKQQAYIDSLKQVEYNYIFPIRGQKAYKHGFDFKVKA